MSVKPVLGQDTSRLLGRRAHPARPRSRRLLGTNVGVDVNADWNRLIPSDKRPAVPDGAVGRPDAADRAPPGSRAAARRVLEPERLPGRSRRDRRGLASLAYRRRRLAGLPAEQAELVRRTTGGCAAGGRGRSRAPSWRWTSSVSGPTSTRPPRGRQQPALRGTTLEGTEVNGLTAEVLPFLSILRPRSTFYDTVADNLEGRSRSARPATVRRRGRPRPRRGLRGRERDGPAGGPRGGARGRDFLALTGDLTFAGLAIETYIIDTVDYYSDHRPVYFAPGLHDTEVVVDAARARGWHVADGETTDADG